jgi:HAD superfamily hydrolase (TIGR01509 family)
MKTILVDAVNTLMVAVEGVWAMDAKLHTLLESFPQRKIVLTNANAEQQRNFSLGTVPYPLFTLNSAPLKTDPSYYQTFLQTYGLQAADVVYFEHNPQACESARQNGIVTHHFDPQKRDMDALQTFLDSTLRP